MPEHAYPHVILITDVMVAPVAVERSTGEQIRIQSHSGVIIGVKLAIGNAAAADATGLLMVRAVTHLGALHLYMPPNGAICASMHVELILCVCFFYYFSNEHRIRAIQVICACAYTAIG